MAERKQGPVKPPTIDLTPRDASAGDEQSRRGGVRKSAIEGTESSASPEAVRTAEPPPVPPKAEPPQRSRTAEPPQTPRTPEPPPTPVPPVSRRPAASWTTLVTAAVVGALLGTALTYVLATMVPLPGPEAPDLSPALAAQTDRVAALEGRLAVMEEGTADVRGVLDASGAALSQQIAALEAGLAEVRAAIPEPVDTVGLETRLRALSSRVDAIAAGASSADAGAIAENLGDLERGAAVLQTDIDSVTTRTGRIEEAVTALESQLAALRSDIETAAAEAEQAPAAAAAQLPLIVSGLESAFATGRPFAAELAGLGGADSDISVPEPLAAQAPAGLVRPDLLDRRFAEAVPAMLAARPVSAGGDWQQSTGDWLAALLALRPAGEIEGDSPEAVVSRLEGAMSRHDYAGASALFLLLPPEMVAAAGTVPADIAAHAAAADLVAALRTRALAPAGVAP